MPRFAVTVLWLVCMTRVSPALATSSSDPPILNPGAIRAIAAGGPVSIDQDWTWGLEASFRVGVATGVELAAPLALGVRLIEAGPGSAIYAGVGIVDLWVTDDAHVLFSPAAVLAGKARMGPQSSLRAAVDITGVEQNLGKGDHPAWIRGCLAVVIDFGSWVTAAAGFAFQRSLIEGELISGAARTGWVGDSRFSVGSVKAQPFSELPTISVHVAPFLDIVLLWRLDINTDINTTDFKYLVGLEIY